jgi:site-specific DNA recombinase
MSKPRSAAIYARISSDATGEGLGVARQLAECRELAATRGWAVGAEYVDNDISAYKVKTRPEYERMLSDLEAGARDAVVVYNFDRLTRQPIQLEEFSALCERAGVRQVATVTSDIDLGTDDGLFTARIFAAFAAKESGRKSARLKSKARQLAEQGMPNGGRFRPFGYEEDRRTVRPAEADVVRQLTARALAGESMRSLAQWLQDSGLPTVGGAEWRSPTVQRILTNPRTAGLREHQGEVVGPAVWDGIITLDQREQLLRMFASKQASNRRLPQRYLLSGLLRCGRCGNKLFSSARKDSRRYVCSSGPDHGGCGRLTVVAPALEEWLAEAVLFRLDSPALADALAGRHAADERHAALSSDLERDEARLKELAEMLGTGELTRGEWGAARNPLEARIQDERRQLAQLSSRHALDAYVGQGEALAGRWGALNLDQQHAIVFAVLAYATVQPVGPSARAFDPARVEPTWQL